MRRSRFRGRGFRRKRSVSWLAGLSSYDGPGGTSARVIGLAAIAGAPNVWAASIGLVIPADLPLHGGEDAVLARVVGRLGFMAGRKNAGAGLAAFGFQMHVALVQSDFLPGGTVSPWDFTSSVGLGNDDIMFSSDVVVPSVAIGGAGTGYELAVGGMERWLEMDVGVKRKVQEDRCIILWFQTVMPGGTTGADFTLLGSLRSLLMRPV